MYKALVSFCGVISMTKDEVRELSNPSVVADLLKAGYIEEVESKDNIVRYKTKATKKK